MATVPNLVLERKPIPAYALYYASIDSIPGVVLILDNVVYFAPTEDVSIYALTDTTHLLVTRQITNAAIAAYVRVAVERRLLAGALTVGGVL